MGFYRLKVVRHGTIIVDGVDSMEKAEEYIENCNPVDDINWSDFLEVGQGGTELQKINIPNAMVIRDFADMVLVSPGEIIKWLFLHGKSVKGFDSEIWFEDMMEFADEHGFICEKEEYIGEREEEQIKTNKKLVAKLRKASKIA